MSPFNFDNQRTHQPWERHCLTTCCDLFYKHRPSLFVAQAVVIKTITVERGEFTMCVYFRSSCRTQPYQPKESTKRLVIPPFKKHL